MKKRFAFFAFLSISALCLISGGGVLTSCKHSSGGGGPAGLDLAMYEDSKNETPTDTLTYEVGGDAPKFYMRSLNYPDKNQIELDSAVYKLGEDGEDEELDPDEDIAVAYKKAQKNYKITLNNMPQQPGSYDFTLSFSADNGQENELEFTVKVSKKTAGGGEITGAAPKITKDLEDGVGTGSVELTVVASVSDNSPITYQWYKDGTRIENATSSSYEAKGTGAYYVKVTANNQTVQSNTANVVIVSSTEPTPLVTIPKIRINSANGLEIKDLILKVPEASDGILSVSVDNADVDTIESYQWRIVEETSGNDVHVTGATNQTFTPSVFAGYYCQVVVDGRKYNSSTVQVIEKDIVMTLATNFGENSYIDDALTVEATSDVPCTFEYQWYKEDETSGNPQDISDATDQTFTPKAEGYYVCKVKPKSIATGIKGSARDTNKVYVRKKTADDPDTPTVKSITGITDLSEGETLKLSVDASAGNGTLSYQWIKGNNPISGATKATYEKSDAKPEDSGEYKCRVINTLNGTTADVVSSPVKVLVRQNSVSGETSGNVNGSFDFN